MSVDFTLNMMDNKECSRWSVRVPDLTSKFYADLLSDFEQDESIESPGISEELKRDSSRLEGEIIIFEFQSCSDHALVFWPV
jgi:hypothetical protein